MENQIDELIEKYKLTEEEHAEVLEVLKKDLFSNISMDDAPSVMFVVGQPGCGKTTFINNSNLEKYVIINSDDYRKFSKYSSEILKNYSTDYAKLTNYDVHLWGDELFNYAVENGYSPLREKAPLDDSLLDVIKEIPSKYEIIINVVVAGNLESLLATRERYEKESLIASNAKLSNIESHNKCYSILPNFISKCLSLNIKVNYVIPNGEEFEIVSVVDNHLNLLEEYRNKSNKHALISYNDRIDAIKQSMIKRTAPKNQFDELDKIEIVYNELNNKRS